MLGFSDISAFSVHSAVKRDDIVISQENSTVPSGAYFNTFAMARLPSLPILRILVLDGLVTIKREAEDTYQEFQCSV